MKMFCEKCGAKLTDGQQFCPNCGEKIPVYCPNCGKRARVNDKFCIECGALLEKSNLTEKPWVAQVIPHKKEADDAGMAFERYRTMLSEKSRLEKLMLTGTGLSLIHILAKEIVDSVKEFDQNRMEINQACDHGLSLIHI